MNKQEIIALHIVIIILGFHFYIPYVLAADETVDLNIVKTEIVSSGKFGKITPKDYSPSLLNNKDNNLVKPNLVKSILPIVIAGATILIAGLSVKLIFITALVGLIYSVNVHARQVCTSTQTVCDTCQTCSGGWETDIHGSLTCAGGLVDVPCNCREECIYEECPDCSYDECYTGVEYVCSGSCPRRNATAAAEGASCTGGVCDGNGNCITQSSFNYGYVHNAWDEANRVHCQDHKVCTDGTDSGIVCKDTCQDFLVSCYNWLYVKDDTIRIHCSRPQETYSYDTELVNCAADGKDAECVRASAVCDGWDACGNQWNVNGRISAGGCIYESSGTACTHDTYNLGSTCNATGVCIQQPPDSSEAWCNATGANRWNLSGDSTNAATCCQDIAGEYKITETGSTDALVSYNETTVTSCCNVQTDCTNDDTCTDTGSVTGTIPNKAYCDSSVWYGGDAGSTQCDAIAGPGRFWIGGEVAAETCCGDDGENMVSRVCYTGACITDATDTACADTATDCTYNDNVKPRDSGSNGSCLDTDSNGYFDLYCGTNGAAPSIGTWFETDFNSATCDTCGFNFGIGGDVATCCGDDAGENYIDNSSTGVGTKSLDGNDACCNQNTDCVFNNTCYDSTSMADLAIYNPLTIANYSNNFYKCIDSKWQMVYLKLTWDGQHYGYCNQSLQCLVNPGSQNTNTQVTDVTWHYLDNSSEDYQIQCIGNGIFIGDHYCNNGNWTTRTLLLADVLYNQSGADYSLFCDSYENALNYYDYPLINYLAKDYFTNDSSKLVNSFCVLRNANGHVALGVSLNQPANATNLPYVEGKPFLELFSYDPDICAGVTAGNTFQACDDPYNIYYNPVTMTIIYSPNINFGSLGFLNAIIDFFSSLFNLFRAGKSVYDVFDLTGNKVFDKVYLLNKGSKSVTGIAGAVHPAGAAGKKYYMAVNYTNFTSNICDAVSNKPMPQDSGIVLNCNSSTGLVTLNVPYGVIFDYKQFLDNLWLDITAKLRLE